MTATEYSDKKAKTIKDTNSSKHSLRKPEFYNKWRRIFQFLVTHIGYMIRFKLVYRLEVEGRENIPNHSEYILAANHLSTLDPPLVCAIINKGVAYMAKEELFDNFFLRWWLNWLGAFAVNRGKLSMSTVKTVMSIKQTGWVLGIFPQGTRQEPGKITNVTKGFASIAKKTKCGILPIGITGTNVVKRFPFTGKIVVKIGKLIPYSDDVQDMVDSWGKSIEELTGYEYIPGEKYEEITEFKKTDTRNYNRRYAKEYGLGRTLFYRWFLYCVVFPVSYLQYTVKVVGRENLKKGEKYLYAANHTSYLDPPFVALASNKNVAFMAKQELFTDKNWLLRFLVKNLGAFAVNREKPEIATFKTVIDILKTNWSLGIFPEGKTSQSHILENVQKGFTLLAKKAKADIVPIGIKGFDGYAGKSLFKKHITITVGKPISYELPPDEILRQWAEQICEYTGYENRISLEDTPM